MALTIPGSELLGEAEAGRCEPHFLLSDGQAGLAGHTAGHGAWIQRGSHTEGLAYRGARNYTGTSRERFQKGGWGEGGLLNPPPQPCSAVHAKAANKEC